MSSEPPTPAQVSSGSAERTHLFISYSHLNADVRKRLRTILYPLKLYHKIDIWDDTQIPPGSRWREEIEQALERTRVALLLVSADFLASDFVTQVELPKLFAAEKQGRVRIFWLPLAPCLWEITELKEIQAAIKPPGRTLSQMSSEEQNEVFKQIGLAISRVLEQDAQQRLQEQRERERQAEAAQQAAKAQALKKAEEERQAQAERERERQQAQEREREDIRQADAQEKQRQAAKALALKKAEEERQAQAERRAREERQRRPSLIRIQTQSATLVKVGKPAIFWEAQKWRVERTPIEVEGYREELGQGVAITMVRIPAGSFVMGSPGNEAERFNDEGPQHRVRLGAFFLGQTPVTQAEWAVVAGWPSLERELNPRLSRYPESKRPVQEVSWEDAMEFCRRLSQRSVWNYTLPSEAQWEYACRAGTTTPFAFGETLTTDVAN